MSAIATSFRIWFITVLLNALFYAIISLIGGEIFGVLISTALFVVGFVITLPFWLVVLVLIEIVKRLPFSATGRICWVGGTLAVCIVLFYASISWLLFQQFNLEQPVIGLLTGTTIAALIAALYLSRSAFKVISDTIISDNE